MKRTTSRYKLTSLPTPLKSLHKIIMRLRLRIRATLQTSTTMVSKQRSTLVERMQIMPLIRTHSSKEKR